MFMIRLNVVMRFFGSIVVDHYHRLRRRGRNCDRSRSNYDRSRSNYDRSRGNCDRSRGNCDRSRGNYDRRRRRRRREQYVIQIAEKHIYSIGIFAVVKLPSRNVSAVTTASGKKTSRQRN